MKEKAKRRIKEEARGKSNKWDGTGQSGRPRSRSWAAFPFARSIRWSVRVLELSVTPEGKKV